MRVEFITPASLEFLSAVDFYGQHSSVVGAAFVSDLEHVIGLVRAFPGAGSAGPASTRRARLRRFPYSIVYRSTTELITVIAVEHHSRMPGYWEDRLLGAPSVMSAARAWMGTQRLMRPG